VRGVLRRWEGLVVCLLVILPAVNDEGGPVVLGISLDKAALALLSDLFRLVR
jgi:hypothetical protein